MDHRLTGEDKERIKLLNEISENKLKNLSLEQLIRLQELLEKKDYSDQKKADKSEEMNAPSIVPGTAINPSFQPSENSILFCLAYVAVDATELLNTANRLLLTASVGENPTNVNTGTIIIPPPNPIIDPNIPATNPNGINQSSSNIIILI